MLGVCWSGVGQGWFSHPVLLELPQYGARVDRYPVQGHLGAVHIRQTQVCRGRRGLWVEGERGYRVTKKERLCSL